MEKTISPINEDEHLSPAEVCGRVLDIIKNFPQNFDASEYCYESEEHGFIRSIEDWTGFLHNDTWRDSYANINDTETDWLYRQAKRLGINSNAFHMLSDETDNRKAVLMLEMCEEFLRTKCAQKVDIVTMGIFAKKADKIEAN